MTSEHFSVFMKCTWCPMSRAVLMSFRVE